MPAMAVLNRIKKVGLLGEKDMGALSSREQGKQCDNGEHSLSSSGFRTCMQRHISLYTHVHYTQTQAYTHINKIHTMKQIKIPIITELHLYKD